ncbi:MAG: tetratricopeptide repeat protein [Candidatus Omnitrophica bacterium]|nr:tetratricopeptide repeat protein [Candidatus Omnitrophota bacterium]
MNKKFLRIILVFIFVVLTAVSFTARDAFAEGDEELFLVAQKAFDDGFYDISIRYIEQLMRDYPQTTKSVESKLLLGQCYFFKSEYLKAFNYFKETSQYSQFKDATLFWLGETYLKGSDYKQAEEMYKQVIDAYPDSIYAPQAYYSLGWTYFVQNDYTKAQDIFEKILKKFPDNQLAEDAAFKIGEILYTQKNYEKTTEHFIKYINTYPDSVKHPEAYFYIGESFYYLNQPLDAVGYYAKSASLSYDNKTIFASKVSLGWCYLKLGKYDLSEKNFNDALSFAQSKSIPADDVYLGLASLYSETNNVDKALSAYSEIVNKYQDSPRVPEALLGRGNTYYQEQKYDAAIKDYRAIINKYEASADYPDIVEKAYFALGWSYMKAGALDLSIHTFETIQSKTDNNTIRISAMTQIGDAYQEAGQLDQAVEVYDKILGEFPAGPYTDYVQYRQAVTLLKQNKIEAATLSLQTLQANFPKSKYLKDAKYYLAVAYFKQEQWQTAMEQASAFLKESTDSSEFRSEANYILGLSNFNLAKYTEAAAVFQKIIKEYPSDSNIVKNSELHIAKCLYKNGNINEALKRFRNVATKYHDSDAGQEALIWLGDHYLEAGDYNYAISHYNEFIKSFPGNKRLVEVYYSLGQAYKANNDYKAAIESFKNISETVSPEIFVKAKSAIAEILSQKMDPDAAIATYKTMLDKVPSFAKDALFKIAEIYKSQNDQQKAAQYYENALKSVKGQSHTPDAEIRFSLADDYELMNNTDKALDEYLKIPYLYIDQTLWAVKAYLRVARIFEDQDEWIKAKQIYQKVLSYNVEEKKFAQERLDWINNKVITTNGK